MKKTLIRLAIIMFLLTIIVLCKNTNVYATEDATVLDLSKESYSDQTTPGTYILTSSGQKTNRGIGFTSNGENDVFNIIIRDLNMENAAWSSTLNFYNSYGNMTVNIIIDGDNNYITNMGNWNPIDMLYTKYAGNITVNFGTLKNGGKLTLTAAEGNSVIGTRTYELDLDYPELTNSLSFGILNDNGKLKQINYSSEGISTDINSLGTTGLVDSKTEIIMEYVPKIIINETTNGRVTTTSNNGVITIETIPDKGYEVDMIKVIDADSNEIEVVNNTFTMPNNDVTISVTFKEKLEKEINPVIKLSQERFIYDGQAKEPDVELTDEDGNIIPENEYTVSYENNINVGTATVIITDNQGGEYKVNGTTTFEIVNAEIVEPEEPDKPTEQEKPEISEEPDNTEEPDKEENLENEENKPEYPETKPEEENKEPSEDTESEENNTNNIEDSEEKPTDENNKTENKENEKDDKVENNIVEENEDVEEKTENETEQIKNPQTGDSIILYIILLVISVIGITITFLKSRNKK